MIKATLKLKTALAAFSIFIASGLQAATLLETFDNPSLSATNNNGVQITYPSGNWYSFGITKPTTPTEADRINGIYSIRMRGLAAKNLLYMMFDKNGAGVVSFNYGSYSNHSGGEFILQKSTNSGSSWENIGSSVTVPAWSGTFLTYSAVVNYNGNIRFRLLFTETTNANTQVNIDDFMITDYNTEQTAIPVASKTTGIYETAQTVTLSSATTGATIHYTLDGTAPTTSSPIYSSPLNITTTTKIRAIAVASGKIDSREEVVIINIPIALNSISGFYNYLPQSGTNLQYYKYTGEAVISFVYWSSATNTAKKIVLQDNSGGIIIDDNFKNVSGNYAIGDKVTGFIAQINNTNDAPVLYPSADFTVLSGNNTIDAKPVTLADVPNKTYQLVQINDLYFDAADGTAKFGVNSFRSIHEGTNPSPTNIVYNTPSLIAVSPNYINTVLPVKINLIGLVMRNNPINSGINSNNPYYYIFPRSLSDLDVPYKELTSIPNVSSQLNISVSGNKVLFETASPEKVNIYSVSGQLVKSTTSSVGMNSIELKNGIYIIKIGTKAYKVTVY